MAAKLGPRADSGTGSAGGQGIPGRRRDADQELGALDPDGDAVKKQLEERGLHGRPAVRRGRHPDPGLADREHDHQGRQGARSSPRSTARALADAPDAADADIPVIAYDRLIRDTENVDYYATFDNFIVGVAAGRLAAERPRPDDARRHRRRRAGPFNIELFAGSPDDNNATFFFNGAMNVLQPLIDDGTLVVKSGQTDFEQAATLRWDGGDRPERAWRTSSPRTTPTAPRSTRVLSPYDGISAASSPR